LCKLEVKPAASRGQPQLVQRRLGVDDEFALPWHRQFEQAAGAVCVDVHHIVFQPAIDSGLDARQHGIGQFAVLRIGQGRGCHGSAQ
jgi:hypothetical protein